MLLLEELSELVKVKGIKTNIIFDSNDQDLASFMIERRSELCLGLSNIIENAGEFAKENVFMKIAKIENNIQLLIEDDGDGFSTEILHRLGDPYVTSRHKDDVLRTG